MVIRLKTYVTYFLKIDTVTKFRKVCFKKGYNLSNKVDILLQEFIKEEEELDKK